MPARTQIVSILFAAILFFVVFEMVRRRYLRERYALVWMGAALALMLLAVWTGLLGRLSGLVGIRTPSNAFFVIAFAFTLLLLLHFSAVVSRLSDQTRLLAQRLAMLEEQQRSAEAGTLGGHIASAEETEDVADNGSIGAGTSSREFTGSRSRR
jgi:hypothetical protein